MVAITHATVATGTDAGNGEVRKAQWNEAHDITGTARTLLGFDAAGDAVEIAGWTLIESITASGSSAVFDNIPQTYADLLLEIVNVSHNGSAVTLVLGLSNDNGSNYASIAPVAPNMISASAWCGICTIQNYQRDFCRVQHSTIIDSATGLKVLSAGTGDKAAGDTMVSTPGGVDALRLSISAGAFDAGTFKLYGR